MATPAERTASVRAMSLIEITSVESAPAWHETDTSLGFVVVGPASGHESPRFVVDEGVPGVGGTYLAGVTYLESSRRSSRERPWTPSAALRSELHSRTTVGKSLYSRSSSSMRSDMARARLLVVPL